MVTKEDIIAPLRRLKEGKQACLSAWATVTGNARTTLPQLTADIVAFTRGTLDEEVATANEIDGDLAEVLSDYLETGIRSAQDITTYRQSTCSGSDIIYAPSGQVTGTSLNLCFNGAQSLLLVEQLYQDDGNGGTTETLSNVTTATNMFQNCYKLEYLPPNLAMPNVTNVNSMFISCYSLQSIPSSLTFDNVTNANALFYHCRNMRSLPNLTMSHCTTFNNAFRFESAYITALPSTLRCSSATNISSMCRQDIGLTSTGGAFVDGTGVLTNAVSAFGNCSALTTITGSLNIGGISMWGGTTESNSSNSVYAMFQGSGVTHCIFTGTYTFCFNIKLNVWGFQNLDEASIVSLISCLQDVTGETGYDSNNPPSATLTATQKAYTIEVDDGEGGTDEIDVETYLQLLGYSVL